jgi:DNA-directed RNA polymerase specialized sigma24 family protein
MVRAPQESERLSTPAEDEKRLALGLISWEPAALSEFVELRAAIEDCLGRIPRAEHRRALLLLVEQELGYEEIAGALATSPTAVRGWIYRARRRNAPLSRGPLGRSPGDLMERLRRFDRLLQD